jgi:TRAP-type C4-dicarboxylate transport system permease small subunit
MIRKTFLVLFWSVVENLGNLGYWVYQIWFNFVAYELNYDTQTYALWQALNHLYLVLPVGMVLFIVRYYIKNKNNLV